MGRGYGGGARFERSLGVTGAGAAEMACEVCAVAESDWGWSCRHGMGRGCGGERGVSGRCELLGLELQKWRGKRV